MMADAIIAFLPYSGKMAERDLLRRDSNVCSVYSQWFVIK